ncbi:MAG: DUF4111 domain-containing protein [Caldilineaceae bacterium]
MLNLILTQIQRILDQNFLGLYLRGSLALGDFISETSDIDLLAVTEQRVDEATFARLAEMHKQLDQLPHPFAKRIEIAYIDAASLRRYQPGQRHPTLGQSEKLAWREHQSNWIVERWAVREHGIRLFGPDPKTLIDPVSTEQWVEAVRSRLQDWVDWANQSDDPDWQLPRSHKAYAVETICRILCTLTTQQLPSKRQAVAWAKQTLPDPWRSIIVRAEAWRNDPTVDANFAEEVRRFILRAPALA